MLPRDLNAIDPDSSVRVVYHPLAPPQFPLMRDGAVRVVFEFVNGRRMDDWFGLFFRAEPSLARDSHLHVGSYLGYARQDGRIEVAGYPGYQNLSQVTRSKSVA